MDQSSPLQYVELLGALAWLVLLVPLENSASLSSQSFFKPSISASILVFLASPIRPKAFLNFFVFLGPPLSYPCFLRRLARLSVRMGSGRLSRSFVLFVGAPSMSRKSVIPHGFATHVNCVASAFVPQIGNKGGNMIQVELRRILGLPPCGTMGQNKWRNRFQRKHGYIPYKGALMHWLNVIGRAVSFSIGSMGCLCEDIALRRGHL
jgi:hypothetical protein